MESGWEKKRKFQKERKSLLSRQKVEKKPGWRDKKKEKNIQA